MLLQGVLLFQLSLLGTLCSLLVKYGNDSEVRDTLAMLLEEAAKKYLKAQKSAPNQKQVGVIMNIQVFEYFPAFQLKFLQLESRLAIDQPVVITGFNQSLLVDWWSIGRLKKLG